MKRFFLILAFSILNSQFSIAYGAVTYDTAGSIAYDSGAVSSITASNTIGGDCTNPLLIAVVAWRGAETIAGTVASAGAMTDSGAGKVIAASGTIDTNVQIFYLAGATGAQSVTASFSSTTDEAHAVVFSACGVNQATPVGTAVSGTDTYYTPLAINVTGDVGGLVFDAFAIQYDSEIFTPAGGQTEIVNTFAGLNQILASYRTASAGTVTMAWNYGSYGGYWGGYCFTY